MKTMEWSEVLAGGLKRARQPVVVPDYTEAVWSAERPEMPIWEVVQPCKLPCLCGKYMYSEQRQEALDRLGYCDGHWTAMGLTVTVEFDGDVDVRGNVFGYLPQCKGGVFLVATKAGQVIAFRGSSVRYATYVTRSEEASE